MRLRAKPSKRPSGRLNPGSVSSSPNSKGRGTVTRCPRCISHCTQGQELPSSSTSSPVERRMSPTSTSFPASGPSCSRPRPRGSFWPSWGGPKSSNKPFSKQATGSAAPRQSAYMSSNFAADAALTWSRPSARPWAPIAVYCCGKRKTPRPGAIPGFRNLRMT